MTFELDRTSMGQTLKILREIGEAALGTTINVDNLLGAELMDNDWDRQLSRAVSEELGVIINPEDLRSLTLTEMSYHLESRLRRDIQGRTIVDYFGIVEGIARDELETSFACHWNARWDDSLKADNWLNAEDGYDLVEMTFRLEEAFGFGISDLDAQQLLTVGRTVRYIWNRNRSAESFTLRTIPSDACESAFIFHELRRLLVVVGGVSREAVRLDAPLNQLLPSWRKQFLRRLQDLLKIELPRSGILSFHKRPTNKSVGELVRLIVEAQPPVLRR